MLDTIRTICHALLITAAALTTCAAAPFFIAKVCDELEAYNPPPNRWQLLREAWDDAQARKAARRAYPAH